MNNCKYLICFFNKYRYKNMIKDNICKKNYNRLELNK